MNFANNLKFFVQTFANTLPQTFPIKSPSVSSTHHSQAYHTKLFYYNKLVRLSLLATSILV